MPLRCEWKAPIKYIEVNDHLSPGKPELTCHWFTVHTNKSIHGESCLSPSFEFVSQSQEYAELNNSCFIICKEYSS